MVESLEPRALLTTLPAGFQEIQVATGVNPTAADFSPDGRMFVANKGGSVTVISASGTKLTTPFYSVPVDTYRDRGLTSILVDPNFATNGHIYIFYTSAVPSNPNVANNGAPTRLVRLTASATNPNVADPASALVMLDNIPSINGIHTGGFMQFGADGMLYLGVGDGDVRADAQDLSNLSGKILRLDVRNYPDVIPTDNPFVGQAGRRGEIWAYGFRNPFSGNINRQTNDILVNDVGAGAWEEVDRVVRGGNYGWPTAEGPSTNPAFVNPLYAYSHDGNGAAATGGAFYAGAMFPSSYVGQYFVADVVQGVIRLLDPVTGQATVWATNAPATTDLDVGSDGALYRTQISPFGAVFKITYTGSVNRPPSAVATSDVSSGVSPLTVNFSGASSTDPDSDVLTYAWNFGDGTTASGMTVQHTYATDGVYNAVLTVSDRPTGGLTSTSQPIVVSVGNRAPIPEITTPLPIDYYTAGQTISFAGTATDPEDGPLPASAFHWSWRFGHNTHTHDFIPPVDGVTSGSFFIDRTGEVAPDQYYRVLLTVTDSRGLSATTFVDIRPVLQTFTLASNLPGATLLLDATPIPAGSTTTGVVGMTRMIEAPSTQLVNGVTYRFVGWSDGGAAEHSITTPAVATTYTAQYEPIPLTAGFEQTQVATGLYEPTSMAVAPDGRVFVTEKPSGVRVVENGQLLATPFISLPVEREGERGVWGIALDPAFAANGYVYVYYTRVGLSGSVNRLSRFTLSAANRNVADPASELPLIDGIPTVSPGWYNGGLLQFGDDGMLYLGVGDTLNSAAAQDLSKLQGKILRINPAAYPNLIPDNNPFVNEPGARGEIWAHGFHNPATGSMLPGTSRLYVNDLGDGGFAEVNEAARGGNFGWPLAEGPANRVGLIDPIHGYASTDTQPALLKGSTFYAGNNFPGSYFGKYFYSDFARGTIETLDLQSGAVAPFSNGLLTPIDIDNGPSGSLYVLSHGTGGGVVPGAIFQIRYVTNAANSLPSPVITLPATGTTYQAGQQIAFSGIATDAEDGNLAAGALEWKVDYRHGNQTDVLIGSLPRVASGAFTIPLTGDPNPDQSYRIWLTARDSNGSQQSVFTDIVPQTSTFTLASNVAGVSLLLDGSSVAAGASTTGVVGMTRVIGAPATQLVNGKLYGFVSWSDGGAATHNISTPSNSTTYTAQYQHQAMPLDAVYSSTPLGQLIAGKKVTYQVTVTNVGTQTWQYSGINRVRLGVYFGGQNDVGAWSQEPTRFSLTRAVAPGQSFTFNVSITAPTTPGTYVLRNRLVKENVSWFSTMEKIDVIVGTLAATYSGTVPTNWGSGLSQQYSVTVTNTGSSTWMATGSDRTRLAVWFGGSTDTPSSGVGGTVQFALPRDIAPGESTTLTIDMKAPTTVGSLALRHRLYHERAGWFSTLLKKSVSVERLAAQYLVTPPTSWTTGQLRTYSITLTNLGSKSWNLTGANPVRLAVYFGGASDAPGNWESSPQIFNLPRIVGVGQSVTFTISVRAPLAAGTYVLRHRLLKDGVNWFPAMAKSTVVVQ